MLIPIINKITISSRLRIQIFTILKIIIIAKVCKLLLLFLLWLPFIFIFLLISIDLCFLNVNHPDLLIILLHNTNLIPQSETTHLHIIRKDLPVLQMLLLQIVFQHPLMPFLLFLILKLPDQFFLNPVSFFLMLLLRLFFNMLFLVIIISNPLKSNHRIDEILSRLKNDLLLIRIIFENNMFIPRRIVVDYVNFWRVLHLDRINYQAKGWKGIFYPLKGRLDQIVRQFHIHR